MPKDPTERFSDRVANYILYRPDYPAAIIPFLETVIGLTKTTKIADIGSGTGKSSAVFLDYGCQVFSVEPNGPMREAAEDLFGHFSNFRSIDGTAEATTLSEKSVQMILSGQAFHWFDLEISIKEFKRIIEPGGFVVLMWNTRNPENAPFMVDYNSFVSEYSDEYKKVYYRRTDKENINNFFGINGCQYHTIPNFQEFTFEGLKGRYLSSSYAFNEQHPSYEKAMKAIQALFGKYQQAGKVKMIYKTELFFGRI